MILFCNNNNIMHTKQATKRVDLGVFTDVIHKVLLVTKFMYITITKQLCILLTQNFVHEFIHQQKL